VAVGPDAAIPRSELIPAEHFPGAVLVAGLVNAHTHLELTGFEGMNDEEDFVRWIGGIIRLKYARSPFQFLSSSRDGLRQCHAAGVTTVADTGDSGAPFDALLEQEGSGIAYLEVFGPDPATMDLQFETFRRRVLELKPRQTERVRLGLSPHAPYSVSGPLYAKVASFAREEDLPLAVHIAESAAESELLGSASGPFAELWKGRRIPPPSLPGRTPVTWLEEHGVLGSRTLCIHAVQASEEDIARLARHRAAVAHCPRSNRRHGHGDAPLQRFRQVGLRVGVGTDSVASVSPLDLLAEARLAREIGGLDAAEALHLVQLGAAEALGLEGDVGSLEEGKWADCTAIRLPGEIGPDRVMEAILQSSRSDVIATFIGGRLVYRRS
jgi:5-methylthioadenosine/S-adenosylhomocysteine deaminase